MRVHSLTATAFGPFAGSVRVDLDDLSRDGLFLLCGPTGAGKTSLLDAIAFALYGRVPGARGQEKRLRSDHAGDSVRTEVACELTLRGERIRVKRRPEQVRPKARGGGSTRDQARLHVQRLVAGGWVPVSTRLDEGGEYLREQVGLSPEQFWQVVLLPQGEFAEFLRAEPDQRAKVLETLFDARRFTDVEEWLAERARTAGAVLVVAEDTVDRLLHRVEQAARGLAASSAADQAPSRPATEDPEQVRGYVAHQLAHADTQFRLASDADAGTLAALGAAETGRDQARRGVRAVDRLLAACRQRDVVADRADSLTGARRRLAAATVAEPLRPLLDADSEAQAQAAQTAAEVTAAYAGLAVRDVGELRPIRLQPCGEDGSGLPDLVGLTASGTPATELRRWSRALRDEVARLADLETEQEAVLADEQRLAELVAAQADRQASLDELDEVSGQLPAALSDLETRREAARVSAAGAEHAAGVLSAAQARLEAEGRAKELTGSIAAAKAEHVKGERATLAAKARWLSLREARLAGIAAELAGQLGDGQDCPVCGSPEHPAPAAPPSTVVTAVDEQAAADQYESAEEGHRRVAARLVDLRGALEICRSATSGATLSVLRRELAAARNADLAARSAAELLPALTADRVALLAGREELTDECTKLTGEQTADRAAAKELSARVRSGRLRLDRARGDDESLARRRARIAGLAEAAESIEQTWSAYSQALVAAARTRTKLTKRLSGSDLASATEATAALLDEPTRSRLAVAIRDHEDALTRANAELNAATEEVRAALDDVAHTGFEANPPTVEATTDQVSDLSRRLRDLRAAVEAEYRAAVEDRDRAVGAITRARGIRGELAELQVLLDQALTECEPLREASAQVSALAALAAGGGANLKKMRLRSYVLAARLEQVAAAATTRLRQMSSGRFGFVHSDDLRGGNRRSGLSVDILDSHTGTQRPTKTLSGGESFMASLALALGLADVVTAESGGIALDTLFVDEGFGSLDPEALDAVMTVLDELRQGGRVVGIVSHVEELRSRVPMQLQIRASSHGSTLDQSEIPGESELSGLTA